MDTLHILMGKETQGYLGCLAVLAQYATSKVFRTGTAPTRFYKIMSLMDLLAVHKVYRASSMSYKKAF